MLYVFEMFYKSHLWLMFIYIKRHLSSFCKSADTTHHYEFFSIIVLYLQHSVLEPEANQIRASILDMAHCIRTFTEEISDYSRKLVGIVQHIEGGEQIVEDGIGMAHTEHVWILSSLFIFLTFSFLRLHLLIISAQLQCASTTLDPARKVLKMFLYSWYLSSII